MTIMYYLPRIIGLFLCCVLGSGLLHAAPAKKLPGNSAHHAQSKPLWKAQDNSLPLASGPGIVICEPVTAPSDTTGSNFGTGCALWLQMTVGGQPQLGKTPLWNSLERARSEMNRPNLQLTSAQALNLAPILGVTHAAIGTLRGNKIQATLTYQLLNVPGGAPVGLPITLTGTEDQIDAGLPQIARTFAQRLGITVPDVPASTGLTPDDLQLLGHRRWQETALTEVQLTAIKALAAHNSLASLMSLSLGVYDTHAAFNAAMKTLFAQAGENPLVWGELAQTCEVVPDGKVTPGCEGVLFSYSTQLSKFALRYPGNYNLAEAEALFHRMAGDSKAAMVAAERITTDTPHSPDGWLTFAATISRTANENRMGRSISELTDEESPFVGSLYPKWQFASLRATQLDPSFGKAWLSLAEAATYNRDSVTAKPAMQIAMIRYDNKPECYIWALEMYQSKWIADPVMLEKIARQASADHSMSPNEAVHLVLELDGCGYPSLGGQVLGEYFSRWRAYLTTHPNDELAHSYLAIVNSKMGNRKDGLAEYLIMAKLLPENAAVNYELAVALLTVRRVDEAVLHLHNAIRLDPDYTEAHFYLGYVHKTQGQLDEAKGEFQTALRLSPQYGPAYAAMGHLLMQQNNTIDAIPNLQNAIRFGDYAIGNYESLAWGLGETGQFDQVLSTGKAALAIYKDGDYRIYDYMADAYLHKKEWDKSLALSQKALALYPDDTQSHENMGEVYLGEGRIPEAQAEWRKVILMPDVGIKSTAEAYLKKYP